MLASTTPFKILSSNNDENTNTLMTATKGKGGGLGKGGGGGLSVFQDVTTTKHGSTIKSTRKALVDVTNSTMHAPRTVGKLAGDQHHHLHQVPTKPSTVQFKIIEKEEKISDHTKPAAIITTSSTAILSSSSSIHKDMDEDMVCSGVSLDEDPYDYVIRKSAEMEMTIQPSGLGTTILPDDELDANLLLFANSLTFGDIPEDDYNSFYGITGPDAPPDDLGI